MRISKVVRALNPQSCLLRSNAYYISAVLVLRISFNSHIRACVWKGAWEAESARNVFCTITSCGRFTPLRIDVAQNIL